MLDAIWSVIGPVIFVLGIVGFFFYDRWLAVYWYFLAAYYG